MNKCLIKQFLLLIISILTFPLFHLIAHQPFLFYAVPPVTLISLKTLLTLLPWLIIGVLAGICLHQSHFTISNTFIIALNGLTICCLILLLALPFIFQQVAPIDFFGPLPTDASLYTLQQGSQYLVFLCALVDTLQVLAGRHKK